MESLGFSSFRELMDMWDLQVHENDIDSRINSIVDGEGYVLFFVKDGNVFGASEDSRVAFAKIKNPDADMPDGWADEATFSAKNLSKCVKGEQSEHVFAKKDLSEIKIIDRDEAQGKLKKEAESLGDKAFPKKDIGLKVINISQLLGREPGKDPDQAPNFLKVQDDK